MDIIRKPAISMIVKMDVSHILLDLSQQFSRLLQIQLLLNVKFRADISLACCCHRIEQLREVGVFILKAVLQDHGD